MSRDGRTKLVLGWVLLTAGLLGLVPSLTCLATGRPRPDWVRTTRDVAFPFTLLGAVMVGAATRKPRA